VKNGVFYRPYFSVAWRVDGLDPKLTFVRADEWSMRDAKADRRSSRTAAGFTMIELVVVVVIIAIIAAIAIPKVSRGSAGAADSALSQDLSTLRAAIDLYQTEHGGTYPSNAAAATFISQLSEYSDAAGNVQATKDATHIYGPYLKALPPLPVGINRGLSTITFTGPAGTGQFGWYFDGTTIWANDPSTDQDIATTPYNTY
jgi:prepilin-type N-terminal cleavage/methylation domain-containing protein